MAISKKIWNEFSKAYEKEIKRSELVFYRKTKAIYLEAFKANARIYMQDKSFMNVRIVEAVEFTNLYKEMYTITGMRFAKWYRKIFQKIATKQQDDDALLRAIFASYGESQAGRLVSTVEQTMKDRFISVIQEQFNDPEFVKLGVEEQARILNQNKFWDKTARWMALRVARTENNTAANLAIEQSSLTMFSPEEMNKVWQTSRDERVRDAHARLEGQSIPFKESFNVGGVMMKRPNDPEAQGDPKQVASQRINCRCRLITVPKEEVFEDAYDQLQREYQERQERTEGSISSFVSSIFAGF